MQVSDAIDLIRNGFKAKPAIEIRSQPNMSSISSDLTDIVNMCDKMTEGNILPAILFFPSGLKKFVARYNPYYSIALDYPLDDKIR